MSGETLLSRWSRRKAAERRDEPGPEAVSSTELTLIVMLEASTVEPTLEAVPPLMLEDVSRLTPPDDLSPFVVHGVGEAIKCAALKKLFVDPHLNAVDGLDTCIDDYSQLDPIPPEVLRELRYTAELRLFEPLDEDVAASPGIEPISATAPPATGETPLEPTDVESPRVDNPAQATPHGGVEPSSVE